MKRFSFRTSSYTFQYILFGVFFGLLFPLIGTNLEITTNGQIISLPNFLYFQQIRPILWMIDSAPLFLGFVFGLVGMQSDRLTQMTTRLEVLVAERTAELQGVNDAVLRENAERKRAEEIISQGKRQWEATVDAVTDLIIIADTHGQIIRCNRATIQIFNAAIYQDLLGKNIKDLFWGEDWSDSDLEIGKCIQEIFLGEDGDFQQIQIQNEETQFPRLNGWYQVSSYPLLIQGDVRGRTFIICDITERKRAQMELLRQKQFFEALVVNSPVAILIFDNDQKIVSCNPAFEKLYGYSQDEVLGKNIDNLIATEETRPEASVYSLRAMQSPVHGISQRRRKDGELVDVELFGVPVNVAGEHVGTLGMYHDISGLVRARQEAEEADRAKSEFLANMSHEIRTPMNGVIGMIELALDTDLDTEQRDFLVTALESAGALLCLLNDILDFSKIEAHKLDLEIIDFDLRTTVENVAQALAQRAEDKGLEIGCLIQPDVPSSLRGDPGRLRQILVNLVGNAIKFTQRGEVVIRAEKISDYESHATIRFSVQDTGIGIPLERQQAVFGRFTQADGSTTRKYGGTGLGLTISKQLVEMMGGEIGVFSKSGEGSTFWFSAEFEKQPNAQVMSLAAPEALQNLPVLVAEDNATNRMILEKILSGFGCRVASASNGKQAMNILTTAIQQGDSFRLALIDQNMPEIDGEQTVRAIKANPQLSGLDIIILTSIGQRGDASRFKALGCTGYLLKPVKQQQLFDALLTILGQKEGEGDDPTRMITRHTISEQKRKNLRILLAEDNPINRKLAVTLLRKAGFSIETAENGSQAIEAVKQNHYSLVLMDVQMPEVDGFEATQQIRMLEGLQRSIPIIAMTAHAMKGDRERCLSAGMDDYITKPLNPQDLFSVIDRWGGVLPEGSGCEETANTPEESCAVDEWADLMAASFEGTALDFEIDSSQECDDFPPKSDHKEKRPEAMAWDMQPHESKPPLLDCALGEQACGAKEPSGWDGNCPVDIVSALPRFSGDKAFFLEMLQEFVESLPIRIKELEEARQDQDAFRLSRLAHNLKGASANFNAMRITELAKELELQAKEWKFSNAPALISGINAEGQLLKEYFEGLAVT